MHTSHSQTLTNFIKFYFDTAYILCCSPFRIVQVPTRNSEESTKDGFKKGQEYHFQVKSWWLQKSLCVLIFLLTLFWFIREIRLYFPRENNDPTHYFEFVFGIVNFIFKCVTLLKFWRSPQAFIGILNFVNEMEMGNGLPTVTSKMGRFLMKKRCALLFSGLYSGMEILEWGFGRSLTLSTHISTWSVGWWWRSIVNAGHYNFFMSSGLQQWGNVTYSSGDSILIGTLAAIGYFQRRILSGFVDYLLLMATMTLWISTNSFATFLRLHSNERMQQTRKRISAPRSASVNAPVFESSGSNLNTSAESSLWEQVSTYFDNLKMLACYINEALGTTMTYYLVDSILFYSIAFDQVFILEKGNPDWSKIFRVVFYFCNCMLILFLAADACYQMSYMKTWLSHKENRRDIPIDELTLILNDLDSQAVSFKGSQVFPITYSLIAHLVGVTVTYFIICVQSLHPTLT